jgi:uncharacterized protein (TIRG00374 family)
MVVLLAVGLPVSAVLLVLAVRGAHLGDVTDAIGDADLGLLAAAVAAIAAVYVVQAARWHVVSRSGLSFAHHFGLVLAALAVNNVLPGRIGDVLRARWLAVDARLPGGRALATVVVDRGTDLAVLAVLFVATVPFATRAQWIDRIALGGLVALALLAAGWLAARAYARRRPAHRAGGRSRGRIRRIARDLLDGIEQGAGVATLVRALLLGAVAWGAWALAAWLVARSLGISLGLAEVLFLSAAMNLGVAIPSSPGFVGAYQWLAVSALAVYDVERAPALAFAILMQATWYVPTTLVGGAIALRRAIGIGARRPAAARQSSP